MLYKKIFFSCVLLIVAISFVSAQETNKNACAKKGEICGTIAGIVCCNYARCQLTEKNVSDAAGVCVIKDKKECEVLWGPSDRCEQGLISEPFTMDDILTSGICIKSDGSTNCSIGKKNSCGDGICTKFKEDINNCPQDCPKENKIFTLSNGRKAEIKIMPETASRKAIERLGELGFNITLKEIGTGNNSRAAYHLEGKKEVKILGFIRAEEKIEMDIDAETGETLSIKRPWWSFLAADK